MPDTTDDLPIEPESVGLRRRIGGSPMAEAIRYTCPDGPPHEDPERPWTESAFVLESVEPAPPGAQLVYDVTDELPKALTAEGLTHSDTESPIRGPLLRLPAAGIGLVWSVEWEWSPTQQAWHLSHLERRCVWLKFGLVPSIDGTDAYAIAEEVSNFLGAELTAERDWSEVLARRHPSPPA